MAVVQIKSVGWWHERLADWMIANPHLTLGEAARHFNCTQSWLSIIKNSDAFKIYWATRSDRVSLGIEEKASAVTEMALDEISKRLATCAEVIPMKQLLEITKIGYKGNGYSANSHSPAPTIHVNVGMVSPELLARARERAQQVYNVQVAEPATVSIAKAPIDHIATDATKATDAINVGD